MQNPWQPSNLAPTDTLEHITLYPLKGCRWVKPKRVRLPLRRQPLNAIKAIVLKHTRPEHIVVIANTHYVSPEASKVGIRFYTKEIERMASFGYRKN